MEKCDKCQKDFNMLTEGGMLDTNGEFCIDCTMEIISQNHFIIDETGVKLKPKGEEDEIS
jgi:hypothetical protein